LQATDDKKKRSMGLFDFLKKKPSQQPLQAPKVIMPPNVAKVLEQQPSQALKAITSSPASIGITVNISTPRSPTQAELDTKAAGIEARIKTAIVS